jgi:hypothetical protein
MQAFSTPSVSHGKHRCFTEANLARFFADAEPLLKSGFVYAPRSNRGRCS